MLLVVLLALCRAATAQSTLGNDFWVTFLPHYLGSWAGAAGYNPTNPPPLGLFLIASAPRECDGAITSPSGWDTTFHVQASRSAIIQIPASSSYVFDSIEMHDYTFHVTSTDSISLIACDEYIVVHHYYEYPYCDATLVIPTPSLGDEYSIQTAPAFDRDHSVFAVVAVEDGTVVDIEPTAEALWHSGGQPFHITLDAGRCCLLKTIAPETGKTIDFTGTRVKSRDGKRIAVFAGNQETERPAEYDSSWFFGGSHLIEQMVPVQSWGKRFVVVSSLSTDSDTVQVTSLCDDCMVRRNGVVVDTLNAGESYYYRVGSAASPAEIVETSQPSAVQQYSLYYIRDEAPPFKPFMAGVRSMATVHPMEQSIREVVFRTAYFATGDPNSDAYNHFVGIATETFSVPYITMDGADISARFQTVPHDSRYSYARFKVSPGTHTVSCGHGGFVAQVYGEEHTQTLHDMFAYKGFSLSAGSMMHILEAQILVDGQYSRDRPDGFWYCGEADPVFTLRTDFEVSHAEWDFGDGGTATGDTVTHHFQGAGDYTVSCDVYALLDDTDSLVNTLAATVHVREPFVSDIYATDCDSHMWYDSSYVESGVYHNTFLSQASCDSTINLHLTLHRTVYVERDTVACEGVTWHDSLYTLSGRYEHWLGLSGVGCDSVEALNLTVRHPVAFRIAGHTQVAYATDLSSGVYRYYVSDSSVMEGETVVWTCSNPYWVLVPLGSFSCKVVVTHPGSGTLTATTTGCLLSATITLNATNLDVGEEEGCPVGVFPNPASGSVTVTGDSLRKVEIHNLLGQLVASSDRNGDSVTIDLQSLPQGVYLVTATDRNGRQHTRKLAIGN